MGGRRGGGMRGVDGGFVEELPVDGRPWRGDSAGVGEGGQGYRYGGMINDGEYNRKEGGGFLGVL